MPFTKLASHTHNTPKDKCYILSSGKQYRIIIGEAVSQQLGWQKGNHVNLLMGDGSDFGILRIETSDTGDYVLDRMSQASKSLKIQRSNFPNVERVKHDRDFCNYEIIDGGLNLDLPDWCLPPQPERPAPAVASPRQNGGIAKSDGIAQGKINAVTYLKMRGYKISALAGGFYQVDDERLPGIKVVELINRIRAKTDLPPITAGMLE